MTKRAIPDLNSIDPLVYRAECNSMSHAAGALMTGLKKLRVKYAQEHCLSPLTMAMQRLAECCMWAEEGMAKVNADFYDNQGLEYDNDDDPEVSH